VADPVEAIGHSAGGDDGVLEDEVDNLVVSDRGDGASVEGDEPPTDERAMVTVPSLS
jgi:hypothetical protein